MTPQQDQRRKAVGEMTSLVLNYRQSLGFGEDCHIGIWISEKARAEHERLTKLVKEIDEQKITINSRLSE